MDIKSGLENLLTFGGSGKVKRRIAEYEEMAGLINTTLQQVEDGRQAINVTLERVIETKRQGLLSLKKISLISNNLSPRDRNLVESFSAEKISFSLTTIEETISAGELAANSAKGLGAGVSTALGAWALVGTFGAASTGTAISSLTGVAATNATLAWLGGGSLAAGGGGIAVGSAVLGGLVVIPALLVSGVFGRVAANKKIKEIEAKQLELVQVAEESQKALVWFNVVGKRAEEVINGIMIAGDTFDREFDRIYRLIYPHIFARFFKTIRKWIRGSYFNDNDIRNIAYIGEVGSSLARAIDQRLLDGDGTPL